MCHFRYHILTELLAFLVDYFEELALLFDQVPLLQNIYPSIVLGFNMCEKSRITQIRFTTRADIVPVIGIISSSSPISLLKMVLDGKHVEPNLCL